MSTKVISTRIELTQHQHILLECDRLGLTVADWVQLQIARSKNWDTSKSEVLRKLRIIKTISKLNIEPDLIANKILELINYVETML